MKNTIDHDLAGVTPITGDQADFPAPLVMDASCYSEALADVEMTEEQKHELLEILWSIMSAMVELGFKHDVCGQIFEGLEKVPALAPDEVDLRSLEER